MNILALETSGVFCSVALWRDGDLHSLHEEAARRHGERLLPMVEDVLARGAVPLNALDAIAFGRGPGSFTGVRIAAAVAQGLAFGAGVSVVGVSTLAALAHAGWRCHRKAKILAAIDARIGEIYWGLFQVEDRGQVRALQPERVSAAEQVRVLAGAGASDQRADFGVGSGWSLYGDVLAARTGLSDAAVDASLACTAADVAELAASAAMAGQRLPPEQAAPVYVRDRVAVKPS